MARVFISYKRLDKDLVMPLKSQIEAAIGEDCWMDTTGIESNAQFADVIIHAIQEAEVVLFMYSQRHAQITDYTTDWTVRELSYAQELGKRIVFVNLDGTPLTSWFVLMFPQQQQIDADSPIAVTNLITNLNQWLNNGQIAGEEDFENGEIAYSFRWFKPEASVSAVTSLQTSVVIPSSIKRGGKEYKVTRFNQLGSNPNVRSIILPDTITQIGSNAFCNWANLESIVIPEGVEKIKMMTFTDCTNLKNITLPSTLKEIGTFAFDRCTSLRSITIPEGVESIGRFAFADCSQLETVILPQSLKELRKEAFYQCTNLQQITLPEGLRKISARTFYGCTSLRHITIPEGVTHIGSEAFANCSKLKNIDIPSTIRKVGDEAFHNCQTLQSIAFPREASIGYDAVDFDYDILGEEDNE